MRISAFFALFSVTILPLFVPGTGFLLENCDILDLSHPLNKDTIYWPGSGAFRLTTVFKGLNEVNGYWYEANNLSSPEHGGTHLDAPVHFSQGSQTTDQIPLSKLVGEACVINITDKSYQDPDYELSIRDVLDWEAENGQLNVSCILLVKTGYEAFWNEKEKYLGTNGTDTRFLHFPGIAPNTTRWIIETRKIRALGLDTASTDYGQSTHFETHQILGEHNVPAFENLKNLVQLPPRGASVVFLPIKIEGGSGGPMRAMAFGWNGPNDPCRRNL